MQTLKLFENINDTKAFAKAKHDATGAVRKHSGDPYFVHPTGVASILEAYGAPDYLIEVGFLHDTREDTPTSYDELEELAGTKVADIVTELTNDVDAIESMGKERYMSKHMMELSSDALTVKLADQLYNTLDYPNKTQLDRLKINIGTLKRNRKLNAIQKELVASIESGFGHY